MPAIRNGAAAVIADESGRGLRLLDLKRGTEWRLDEDTSMWGAQVVGDYPGPEAGQMKRLEPVRATVTGEVLTLTCTAGGERIVFHYSLLEDGVKVRLAVPDSDEIKAVSMPGAFLPAGEGMKLLLPVMQGMLWDGRGQEFRNNCRSGQHTGFSMMMYGILGESGGLTAAAETAEDCIWQYGKDADGFGVQNIQDSSIGSMRYERELRFYFTDPGIVPIAKRYRARVRERGRFASWEEKIAERPNLERLFGSLMCFVGYCRDDLDYAAECRKLRDYGFDRALVYPVSFSCFGKDFRMGGLPPIGLSREEIGRIRDIGYDVSPWTWITEAAGTPENAGIHRLDRDGNKIFAWQIDNFTWYKTCAPEMFRFEEKAAAGEFDHMTWDHFDVLTCAAVSECYASDHAAHQGRPMSRGETLAWLRKTLTAGKGKGEKSRAVSSENFNDLFGMEYDIGSVKAWPLFGLKAFRPVPLTGLVYHDSIIHSWWEVHNYNASHFSRSIGPDLYEYGGGRADLMSSMDALYGCPPDVFPFGAQYGWTGRGSETFVYRSRFEDPATQYALSRALPVARLHRRTGKAEMTGFEILSEDGQVQRTAFAGGTEITANLGTGRRTDIRGIKPIGGQSWREN